MSILKGQRADTVVVLLTVGTAVLSSSKCVFNYLRKYYSK